MIPSSNTEWGDGTEDRDGILLFDIRFGFTYNGLEAIYGVVWILGEDEFLVFMYFLPILKFRETFLLMSGSPDTK